MADWMDQGIETLKRTYGDNLLGLGDTALSMGSSFIHGAAQGMGGLLTLGATGSADAATDTIQNYQAPSWLPEYHPQTATGQIVVGGIEKFFVGYDEQVKQFTDLIATGDAPLIPKALQGPVGASYLYAGYMALPMMFGVGRTTGKPLPVRGYDKTSVQNALKNRAEKYLEPSYMSEVLKKVNPREWKRLSAAGLLESELATMSNAMHTAALNVPIVKDFVYRITGDSGALGYFRPAQGAARDGQSWHPSGKGMEWAERKVGSSSVENQFKDTSSDYYIYTARNENISDRFIDIDSKLKGFRGRNFELIPSGTPKEMRAFVDNFTREVDPMTAIQSGGKIDLYGEFPAEGRGIMIFKAPKGMTLDDLKGSDQSLGSRFWEEQNLNVEGRPEGQQELTDFERNALTDTISLETDWSPWADPNDSSISTPDQFTTRSDWVNYAIANNEVRMLGSYNEGKVYKPEGVFTRGYPSFESAVEGGPLIGLNPKATTLEEAPIEGIGKIPKDDELDRLGDLLGLNFNRGNKNKIKEVLKTVKKKWRTKRREGKTVEHEVDHFNDWLQSRLLGKDHQPTDVDAGMVKDYSGRERYIDPEKEFASLYDKDIVDLSELMLDSFERYKWNKNIANEASELNKVKHPTLHEWTPSSKTWEELTHYERQAITSRSSKNVLWSALELKPRLEELARYVRDTGKNLDDIILESASQTKHHGKGISDISDGLAYIFNRDPDLLPSISNLLETPQTQYPSQFDFDLFKSGAAMTPATEALSPIPEWQGLITAGKLSAAGMQ